jgi:small-conductance mechanosensitive channel
LLAFFSDSLYAENVQLTQATSSQLNATTEPVTTEKSLVMFNRNIVTFYVDLLGMTPKKRVERAKFLINALLSQSNQLEVSTQKDPLGVLVKINDNVVFIIANEEIALSRFTHPENPVQASVKALKQVISEKQQISDAKFLTQALVKTGLATLLFGVMIWILSFLKARFQKALLNLTQAKKLNLGGAEEHLRSTLVWLVKYLVLLTYWVLVLIISYQIIAYVFEQFPYTRAWSEQLHDYLFNLAFQIAIAILNAIPDLFTAFVIFMMARFVTQITSNFFDSVAAGQTKLKWVDQDVASPTKRIIIVVVWLFAFVMAYPYLPGSGSEAFKGVSVLVGLMLSLGASSLVSQAGSGLILTYTRTFRRGEYVSIGEHQGTVVDLGLFNTRIRNGMGVELAIPNAYILNEVTHNYSRVVQGAGFVVDTTVTIGYDTPWRQVEAMLLEAASKTSGVLVKPMPVVFQTALSDFYPEYRLVCQAIPEDARGRAEVMSALNANIQDVFNQYGVQIMSPHYLSDPEAPKLVPESEWHKAPAKPPK